MFLEKVLLLRPAMFRWGSILHSSSQCLRSAGSICLRSPFRFSRFPPASSNPPHLQSDKGHFPRLPLQNPQLHFRIPLCCFLLPSAEKFLSAALSCFPPVARFSRQTSPAISLFLLFPLFLLSVPLSVPLFPLFPLSVPL